MVLSERSGTMPLMLIVPSTKMIRFSLESVSVRRSVMLFTRTARPPAPPVVVFRPRVGIEAKPFRPAGGSTGPPVDELLDEELLELDEEELELLDDEELDEELLELLEE